LALWKLFRFLRRERFDLIEVSTPKGALIGSLAAKLAGTPCVVHLLRGLAYQGRGGLRARLLRFAHAVPCRFSKRVVSISETTLERACNDGICPRDKIVVLGHGSSNGVDLERFSPPSRTSRLNIPEEAIVAGFVGRLTRDKGIDELVEAFSALGESRPDLYLLLVGDYEEGDRPPRRIIETVDRHPRIRSVGWKQDTPRFFAAMDFFVLPTHREGFGTVLLEAAAMGLPVVTTGAAGWWDVIDKDKDAMCLPIGDAAELEAAMATLADDAASRNRMGTTGRRKVEQSYSCSTVWSLQEREFRRLLDE
jgi:glycosyltransferase involved in cell wall biosynthesis